MFLSFYSALFLHMDRFSGNADHGAIKSIVTDSNRSYIIRKKKKKQRPPGCTE